MSKTKKLARLKALFQELGVEVQDVFTYQGVETISISLDGLYHGYGHNPTQDLMFTGNLLTKLASKGWKNEGINLIYGYYDSVDDLILRLTRPIKKGTK